MAGPLRLTTSRTRASTSVAEPPPNQVDDGVAIIASSNAASAVLPVPRRPASCAVAPGFGPGTNNVRATGDVVTAGDSSDVSDGDSSGP